MLSNERVCHYLRAGAKPGAAERYAEDAVYHAVAAVALEVCRRFPPIAKAVALAAKSGFIGDHLVGHRFVAKTDPAEA
jgi:hypothetical protein